MILSSLLLFGWTVIFYRLISIPFSKLPDIVRVVIGFLLTSIFLGYTLFLLGFLMPHSQIVYILTAFSLVRCFFIKPIKIDKSWLVILLITASLFLLIYNSVWRQNPSGISLAIRGVWGDWGNHLGLPLYYQSVNHTTLANPFVSGSNFTYTLLPSILTSIPLHLGASVRFSIFLFGISWSICTVILLIYLGQLLGLKRSTLLIPLLFYLNGNLSFTYAISDIQSQPLGQFISHIPQEYGHLWEQGYHLGTFLDIFFVSQRSFILGFPLGLTILVLILSSSRQRDLLIPAIVFGLLPLIHVHSFIAVFVIVLVYSVFHFRPIWILSILIAMPYFIWLKFFNSSLDSGFMIYKLGWLSGTENWIWFWIKNAPLIIPGLIGTFFLWQNQQFRFLAISGWALFILSNLVQFQPNLADNNKLLVWWYLIALIFPALILISRFKWATPVVTLICTLTGILQLLWIFQNNWQFVNTEGLQLAQFAKTTCVNRRWLTSDAHNHPVFTFAGRPLVMGYRGWLWTWGINYSQLESEVAQMFTFPQKSKALFQKHSISYVVIGQSEISQYHPDINLWEKFFPVAYSSTNFTVFAVSPCAAI